MMSSTAVTENSLAHLQSTAHISLWRSSAILWSPIEIAIFRASNTTECRDMVSLSCARRSPEAFMKHDFSTISHWPGFEHDTALWSILHVPASELANKYVSSTFHTTVVIRAVVYDLGDNRWTEARSEHGSKAKCSAIVANSSAV